VTSPILSLAASLGDTHILSSLLRKARKLGVDTPERMASLAVQRGCTHYPMGDAPPDVPPKFFSDEELAVALIAGEWPAEPRRIRLCACLLGKPGMNADRVARLAGRERCEPVLRYIAGEGQKVEPNNPFWPGLLAKLGNRAPALPLRAREVLPHPSRFYMLSGVRRGERFMRKDWIRAKPQGFKADS
jgi:hypothetical protein